MAVVGVGVVVAPRGAGIAAAGAGGVQGQLAIGPAPVIVVVPIVAAHIFRVVRLVLLVPNRRFAFAVIQQAVVGPAPFLGVGAAAAASPCDFVAEVGGAEDGVHQHTEVAVGVVVAVQVEAAGGLEDAVAFQQSGGHKSDVGGFVFGSAGFNGCNDGVDGGIVVLNGHFPIRVGIGIPVPDVADAGFAAAFVMPGAVGLRQRQFLGIFGVADGRAGTAGKGFVGGEGGVDGNQVNAFVVEMAQEPQIVHNRQGAVGDIQR